MSISYQSSQEYILALLARLDFLLRIQQQRLQHAFSQADRNGSDLINPGAGTLERPVGQPVWETVPLAPVLTREVQAALNSLEDEIEARKAASLEQGIQLRLEKLSQLFDLDQVDLDVLLICLAPELDLNYQHVYEFLQQAPSQKVPSVDLILGLLYPDFRSRLEAQQRFNAQSPLMHYRLAHFLPTSATQTPFYLDQTLRLDGRIRRYLMDDDEPDQRILPLIRLITPEEADSAFFVGDGFMERLLTFTQEQSAAVIYLQGPPGAGKMAAAQKLSRAHRRPLLVIMGERMSQLALPDFEDCLIRILREAGLQNALVYWEHFDELLHEDTRTLFETALEALGSHRSLVILGGEAAWQPGDLLDPASFARIRIDVPNTAGRLELWRAFTGEYAVDEQLQIIASQLRMSAGQIRSAAATAFSLARWRPPGETHINLDDLLRACRLHSNQKLASLAQKVPPHYTWDDLILPEEQVGQLKELCDQVRYRSQVMEVWGFAQKMALGKGITALFTGPPGTGKTMAADILAGTLDLDLYRIDLSTVVSKYIGETEKNLARIFAEAATSNAILFFDEADALFGKRTEVKDAHDRYANLEISYLLQQMDAYEGLVILATNFRQNLDEAFLRRMQFVIDFPLPGPDDRLRIWRRVWPDQAPRSADVNLPALAEELELAGGSIRNIALAAAYLAAAEGKSISMPHLRRAAEGEYKKMGKFISPAERMKWS